MRLRKVPAEPKVAPPAPSALKAECEPLTKLMNDVLDDEVKAVFTSNRMTNCESSRGQWQQTLNLFT